MIKKNVLILGVTGQDGSYLSKLLIDLGFESIQLIPENIWRA